MVTHLVYPIICPDDQILEIYEEDPQEYINLSFDQTSEYDSPENAALGFIATALYKTKDNFAMYFYIYLSTID